MALAKVREYKQIIAYDLDADSLARYVKEMPDILGVECVAARSVQEVVTASDLVVTATPSTEPFVRAEWLHPRLHITAKGSDATYKQELESDAHARAELLVCDLKNKCFERSELHHGLVDGSIVDGEAVVELGDLTSGRHPGRADDQQVTICDLTGVGVQDAAIATLAYEKAVQGDLGTLLQV